MTKRKHDQHNPQNDMSTLQLLGAVAMLAAITAWRAVADAAARVVGTGRDGDRDRES